MSALVEVGYNTQFPHPVLAKGIDPSVCHMGQMRQLIGGYQDIPEEMRPDTNSSEII